MHRLLVDRGLAVGQVRTPSVFIESGMRDARGGADAAATSPRAAMPMARPPPRNARRWVGRPLRPVEKVMHPLR